MILFHKAPSGMIYASQTGSTLSAEDLSKLKWLFGNAEQLPEDKLAGTFIGPRKEMITPWSTNAVEITQNMGIPGILRIECYSEDQGQTFDPMLSARYNGLDQELFTIHHAPDPISYISDISSYNQQEGLALNQDEIDYLNRVSEQLGRELTDSEVFGFSQVNSEHCRHKIFNGTFIINDEEMRESLFQLIKKTSKEHPNRIVSAYKDNVAFVRGPVVEQFAPKTQDKPDYFETRDFESVISLKAETHNFPTTVEPFNGAATGSGGEIRDRIAGGKASIPLAGTAVYMTSYSRLENNRPWEKGIPERNWLYQTPADILIKASDGASDFGNKFGQPLICGSVLTFEHGEQERIWGYDKVIMLAGGVGYGKLKDSKKDPLQKGDLVVVMGGDNYRIGMGGGAVSSVATGEYNLTIELNAVQRSNPEMQKRVANAIRALAEMDENPILSIHDHGAGGHLNCLSELLEDTGGYIEIEKLPVGDPTLSDKEIIGNESQERMGLVIKKETLDLLIRIAERERAPIYTVGEATGDQKFVVHGSNGKNPIDWKLDHMFGSSPETIMNDHSLDFNFLPIEYSEDQVSSYLEEVLQLEAVGCKDWLTNKVDRSVTGRVAMQQTTGAIQLPLNNVAIMALDFKTNKGIATSIGHAPIAGLINSEDGSRLSVTESLTNLVFAPIEDGLKGVSLSANWMWPARHQGEDERLYKAVKAISDFAIDLGINIPTGKDSLSMTQKYPDGQEVYSPGTVIISTVGEVSDIRQAVTPEIKASADSRLLYIPFGDVDFHLGGSSFAQIVNRVGSESPTVSDPVKVANAFHAIQELIKKGLVLAGHDVSAGGLVTTLLEMNFPNQTGGLDVTLESLPAKDPIRVLFSEQPAVVLQIEDTEAEKILSEEGVEYYSIGTPAPDRTVKINSLQLDIDTLRDLWFRTSFLLDERQSGKDHAGLRFQNYKSQPLEYQFPEHFEGSLSSMGLDPYRKSSSGVKAAIIREKGVNGDREMAYALYLAGFDVKDVHMTDLISGRETLEDIQFIVFVGGFSNSDVLGSAKGWAGAFLYNEKAKKALDNFYARPDTLSLGVCNGCQLMMELGLVYPGIADHPKMEHNSSGKFESAFITVAIPENNSVLFSSMSNSRIGVWLAHGEGRFNLPDSEDQYNIVGKYSYTAYPGNPNGSDHAAAFVSSKDGRHNAIMPHIERSLFPWNWPHYPSQNHEISPWMEAFVSARTWVEGH